MGMESICGKVDYRLENLKNLNAVSRPILLQKTQALGKGKPESFPSYKKEMEDSELMWRKKMKWNHEKGFDEKQEPAKRKEERRLDILDFLKSNGGPFTDSVSWTYIWPGKIWRRRSR